MKPLQSASTLLLLAIGTGAAWAEPPSAEATGADLSRTITALDQKVFDAYNRCNLDTFGSYFSPTVEFDHDTGGVIFDRAAVVANTRKYICNKVRRELIPGMLRIFPIKDVGTIEEGDHRFCELASGTCEGGARFVMVWQLKEGQWQMTRVLSYGHRALADAEKAAREHGSAE
jgi:hypothetical protein